MQQHISLLGWKVKDTVTGFVGVATTIGLDLYGCVQAIVQPSVVLEKGGAQKCEDSRWFDVSRLEKVGRSPVMKRIPEKGDLVVAGTDNNKPLR